MFTLVQVELFKIFKKWRTYIGFIAIAVLVPIIQVALLLEGEQYLNFLTSNLKQSFVFVGNLLNGYLIANVIMQSLFIHIPFLIALVAGEILAGEATGGTYRMLLTRPVSRIKIVTAKFIAVLVYTNLLVLWLAIMSLGLSVIIFGTGELIVIKSNIIIFAKDDIIWRFMFGFGFAALSMSVVASLAFLFSSLVENAIGPIITTMAIIIIFIIISALNIQFLEAIKPFLFTNYMLSWRLFFDKPLETEEIIKSTLILAGHIIVLFSVTLYIFKKKDILS